MNIDRLYELYVKNPSVQTDTRKLRKGDIFFALKGPNFDGNTFVEKALNAGAVYAVTDEPPQTNDERIIRVDNSLLCLQQLAAYHRKQFNIPFIAITGSNGKTTTKELVHAVLSSHFVTYTTEGNLNNHIGVPLTILKIKKDAAMAVVEMGANHQHEIESYCNYAMPNYGLITNIGKAHLEGFGGEEGVKKGKGELFVYLESHGGMAFVNALDPNVKDLALKMTRKIYYGDSQGNEIQILKSDPFLKIQTGNNPEMIISTHLVGAYNAQNVLAAVTIGKYFDVPEFKIKHAIESYLPSNSRSQMIKQGSNTIILDAYNANPGSMKAAIENFAAMKGQNKVLLLGAMKELGDSSKYEHEQLINLIEKYTWKEVALAGIEFSSIQHPFHSFENSEEVGEWFRKSHFKDSLILVKGSRSMQMEKAVL